jgi:hypothetical protein
MAHSLVDLNFNNLFLTFHQLRLLFSSRPGHARVHQVEQQEYLIAQYYFSRSVVGSGTEYRDRFT